MAVAARKQSESKSSKRKSKLAAEIEALKQTKEPASKSSTKKKKKRKMTRKAIDALILENREHGKRLAWSFLSNWRVRMPWDEVESVVGAALCEAANRFDPDRGVAFRTFFFYHLRGMLLKEISRIIDEQKSLQFVPHNVVSEVARSDQNAYGGLGLSLVEKNNPEKIFERRELAQMCLSACSELDTLEQEVVVRYFMYDEPLVGIAKELGYCRCHISRVKSRALGKLEKLLKDRRADVYLYRPKEELEPTSAKKRVTVRKLRQNTSYTGGRGRRRAQGAQYKAQALTDLVEKSS